MTEALESADVAAVCSAFADRLGQSGIGCGPHQISRLAGAIELAGPVATAELYWLARVTLLGSPGQIPVFDAVFDQIFRGLVDLADFRGDRPSTPATKPQRSLSSHGADQRAGESGEQPDQPPILPSAESETSGRDDDAAGDAVLAAASAQERLAQRDFAQCSVQELAELDLLISRMRVVLPTRPSRWVRHQPPGRLDLRRTLRSAHRTAGDPVRRAYRRRGHAVRGLVLIADVSGSMQSYSRVYLRLLQSAVVGAHAEAYVFATRLTRVTRRLGDLERDKAIGRALQEAPDVAGGTRIGAAIKNFLDTDGRRGRARGAVVVIVSDGWERSDPALLGEQMARLHRLAHRVIWVNPRKAASGFVPATGGMTAALPHVDNFVAGHSLASLLEVLDAVRRS